MAYSHDDYDNIFIDDIFQESTVVYFDEYFSTSGQNLVTSITIATAILGTLSNLMVLFFFHKVVDLKPIQSSLWTNLAVCYLVKCLGMFYSSLGDFNDNLSNTEVKCRIRYALPLSLDIVCISCFLMLMFERTIALHCPAFYSILPDHAHMVHCFCWSYGGAYFLFIVLRFQFYDSPWECTTPYTHMTPIDSVQFVSFLAAVLLVLAFLTSLLFLYPSNYSKVEKIRLQMEMNGSYLAIAFGTALLVFWIPRQIVIALFWFEKINLAKYTIAMKMSSLVLELSVLNPFLAMMATNEFRTAVYCMVTMASLRPIKRKMLAQESYKNTIRKLVESERKASSTHKERYKIGSISNRSTSTAMADRSVDPAPQTIPAELQARNDYFIGQDLTANPALDI